MSKKSLLFCASEVYPFVKTGGLADVAHSLPRALQEDYKVQVVMPLYASIDKEKFKIKTLEKRFSISMNQIDYAIELYGCTYEGIEYLFIYSTLLCEREFLYGTPNHGYQDNPVRFAIFNHAIVELLRQEKYDIAHLNDWQSALVPLLIDQDKTIETKTLFTIHNLAYQGVFDYEAFHSIGVNPRYFNSDAIEFYGKVNFMKAGVAYADAVTTVSPSYAKEILTAEFGYALDGFLRHHKKKLTGILNGIDTEHFAPSSDKLIEFPFTTLTQKVANKKSYLKEIGLKGIKKPLFVFIGRFTAQKGVDLLIDVLPKLALQECNVAILGEGKEEYQTKIQEIVSDYPNVHCVFTYNEALSHKMYASADFLLMPSIFEPCGLAQMIAMNYAALPIVHRVGGLKDSVHNYKRFNKESTNSYGIVFEKATPTSFVRAIKQALELYETKKDFNLLVKHNMLCDFSWKQSAKQYIKLYKQL